MRDTFILGAMKITTKTVETHLNLEHALNVMVSGRAASLLLITAYGNR